MAIANGGNRPSSAALSTDGDFDDAGSMLSARSALDGSDSVERDRDDVASLGGRTMGTTFADRSHRLEKAAIQLPGKP
jgi:hypothetical protein